MSLREYIRKTSIEEGTSFTLAVKSNILSSQQTEHVLIPISSVRRVINMTAISVVDAQK